MEHENLSGTEIKIIEFFKEYYDKINQFRAIEIWRFVKFVFPENQNINWLFDFKYDKSLSLLEIKEAIQNHCLTQTIRRWIRNNVELAYSEMDGVSFRKLLKLIELDDYYEVASLSEVIIDWVENKYLDNIYDLPEKEILDILNGKEE